MRTLADTHVVLWWYFDDPKLPRSYGSQLEELERRGEQVGIADISLWEIAKLVEVGRLRLSVPVDTVLEDLERSPMFAILPLTARIAADSTRLGPRFPRDPADQLIAATARCNGLTLMTCDDRIREAKVVAIA